VRAAFMLMVLAAGCAQAQGVAPAVTPGAVPLSFGRAIEQARTYESKFQAAQASYRAESEILPQARGALLPEVSATANRTYNRLDAVFGAQSGQSLNYYSGGSSISLRQPLYRPENWSRYQQAKAEVRRLDAVLVTDRNRLSVEVAGAYLEALRAHAEYKSHEAQLKSFRAQAAAADRALPLGLASTTDRDQARARAELATLRLLQAEGKAADARRQLEKMVGVPAGELMAPRDDDFDPGNLVADDLLVWLDKARAGSYDVRAARANLEVAREGVDRARAGHKPTLDLVAGRSKSTSESFSSINNVYYNSSVGVQLTVPLYAGGRVDSGVRQAVAQMEKAQAQLDGALRETDVMVEREYVTLQQAGQRLRAHTALVQSARQNATAAQSGLERGNRSQLDVLEAQGQLLSAQYERSGAWLELLAARMRLQSLAGEVDEKTVAQLDRLLVVPVALGGGAAAAKP
jgi:protease secretion system outer membrane protein